uniref:SPRY domain-containing protein 7 n=1 Tax=Mus spicilegus TaxID=10103 RepID=A0A8C6G9N9_MUSSI
MASLSHGHVAWCCLRCCRDSATGHIPLKEMPALPVDKQHTGTDKVNLNKVPFGRNMHSLVMRNDGALYHNNEEESRLPANSLPQEGDVAGITYDHVELNVYLNGKNMHRPASGIRGTVYPVVYVDDNAILSVREFYHTPPPGFEIILFEQQIF